MPWLALGLFAGLRPTELRRISWGDVDLQGKTIVVRGAAAKLRQRRLVELVGLIPTLTVSSSSDLEIRSLNRILLEKRQIIHRLMLR